MAGMSRAHGWVKGGSGFFQGCEQTVLAVAAALGWKRLRDALCGRSPTVRGET